MKHSKLQIKTEVYIYVSCNKLIIYYNLGQGSSIVTWMMSDIRIVLICFALEYFYWYESKRLKSIIREERDHKKPATAWLHLRKSDETSKYH